MSEERPIPDSKWRTIVEHAPIVSVDLIVTHDDGIVLGKRTNEPAKGEWFPPGGRVRKHERLTDAVHRIAESELGVSVTIDRQLGVYEHLYDVADVENAGGKHYIPVGYVVTPDGEGFVSDGQHTELRSFSPPFEFELHPYVREYLVDAGVLVD